MHTLLIYPPFYFADQLADSLTPHLPLGLAYIAGSLKQNGHRISVIDAYTDGYESVAEQNGIFVRGLSPDDVCQRVTELQPDVILLSLPFTVQSIPALDLAEKLKNSFPDIPIIIGGPHATADAMSLIELPFIDVVVRGEGEEVIPAVLERLYNKLELSNLPGIVFKDRNGRVKDNGRGKLINNLDSLPLPLWEAFDMEHIWHLRGERSATIITSRGCTYSCSFCSIHQVMGRTFRYRSPQNVLKEIDTLVSQFGVEKIYFEDDNLTLDSERAKTLFQMIIDRDYSIKWYPRNGIRMETLDPEMLVLMKRSGCSHIWIAPESGSPDILKNVINKRLNSELVFETAQMILEVGIPVTSFFVIGFPQETREDLKLTFSMALTLKKMGVNDFWFSCAIPYLGTKLFDMCVRLRPEIDWINQSKHFSTHLGVIDTVDFNAGQIQSLRDRAMHLLNTTSDSELPGIEDFFMTSETD